MTRHFTHSFSPSRAKLSALLLVLLLLFSSLAILVPVPEAGAKEKDTRQENVIDPNLLHHLENDETDSFEVLVQFDSSVNSKDLTFMKDLDFEVYEIYDTIPLVFALGTRDGIYRMANYQRTFWMEYNAPMQYLMNLSTYTIQAQKVHERQIISPNGREILDPIDGTGVTVVVLDSGIDGVHPDLEYDPADPLVVEKPSLGDKLIFNAKKDQNYTGNDPELAWIPGENTDTSSGHGTHCAGTVAGTGEASGGDIIGVAPGAWLIGLSMGELFATIDEFSGLSWVYDHSRPEDNPANIRVVSNSWGPGEPFDNLDPNDASIRMVEKLVYENSVAVVFAAGNDGRGNHDGASDTVNIFSKVPGAISVAASQRDGSGISDFSSRGQANKMETFPDIAAPGVAIWSAAATKTLIGAAIVGSNIIVDQGGTNPYYLAISGTSMATPHVAGLAALLWQACPSLKVSDAEEDYQGDLPFKIADVEGDLYEIEKTRIHEVELIMKLTADYIKPTEGNLVPTEYHRGIDDRKFDYAQGYGLVNADRAVALALYLNKLRDPDGDGEAEYRDKYSVFDAYEDYKVIMKNVLPETMETDVISTSWEGKFVDMDKSLQEFSDFYGDTIPSAVQDHPVYIPETARELKATLTYYPYNIRVKAGPSIPTGAYADLTLTIDTDGDGDKDYPSGTILPGFFPFLPSTAKTHEKEFILDLTASPWNNLTGREWVFDVFGYALSPDLDAFYSGLQAPYSVKLEISLDPMVSTDMADYRFFEFEEPSELYRTSNHEGTAVLPQYYYDMGAKPKDDDAEIEPVWFVSSLVIALVAVAALAYKMRIPDVQE